MNDPELRCENGNGEWALCMRSVQGKLDSPESAARMAVLRVKTFRVGIPGREGCKGRVDRVVAVS